MSALADLLNAQRRPDHVAERFTQEFAAVLDRAGEDDGQIDVSATAQAVRAAYELTNERIAHENTPRATSERTSNAHAGELVGDGSAEDEITNEEHPVERSLSADPDAVSRFTMPATPPAANLSAPPPVAPPKPVTPPTQPPSGNVPREEPMAQPDAPGGSDGAQDHDDNRIVGDAERDGDHRATAETGRDETSTYAGSGEADETGDDALEDLEAPEGPEAPADEDDRQEVAARGDGLADADDEDAPAGDDGAEDVTTGPIAPPTAVPSTLDAYAASPDPWGDQEEIGDYGDAPSATSSAADADPDYGADGDEEDVSYPPPDAQSAPEPAPAEVTPGGTATAPPSDIDDPDLVLSDAVGEHDGVVARHVS